MSLCMLQVGDEGGHAILPGQQLDPARALRGLSGFVTDLGSQRQHESLGETSDICGIPRNQVCPQAPIHPIGQCLGDALCLW